MRRAQRPRPRMTYEEASDTASAFFHVQCVAVVLMIIFNRPCNRDFSSHPVFRLYFAQNKFAHIFHAPIRTKLRMKKIAKNEHPCRADFSQPVTSGKICRHIIGAAMTSNLRRTCAARKTNCEAAMA